MLQEKFADFCSTRWASSGDCVRRDSSPLSCKPFPHSTTCCLFPAAPTMGPDMQQADRSEVKVLTWLKSVVGSCLDLEQCSLKVLEPEGSPSLCLLKLLAEKGCTVMELSDFLQAMEHTEVLQLLSPPGRPSPWARSPEAKETASEGNVSFDQMTYVKYFWNMYMYGASFVPLGWD